MGARAVRPRGRHDRFPTRKTKKSAQSQQKTKTKQNALGIRKLNCTTRLSERVLCAFQGEGYETALLYRTPNWSHLRDRSSLNQHGLLVRI